MKFLVQATKTLVQSGLEPCPLTLPDFTIDAGCFSSAQMGAELILGTDCHTSEWTFDMVITDEQGNVEAFHSLQEVS